MKAAQITLAAAPAFVSIGGAESLRPDRPRRETNRARGTSERRHIRTRRAVSRRNMQTKVLLLATVEPGVRFKSP